MKRYTGGPEDGYIGLDLTHEFRREQNRRKLREGRAAFVCGLMSGMLILGALFLVVHVLTR